jgi:hypothetical protein
MSSVEQHPGGGTASKAAASVTGPIGQPAPPIWFEDRSFQGAKSAQFRSHSDHRFRRRADDFSKDAEPGGIEVHPVEEAIVVDLFVFDDAAEDRRCFVVATGNFEC